MRKAILAMLLLAATAAQAQVVVTDKAIVRKTGRLHLDIHYPATGIATLDRLFDRRSWAKVDPDDLKGATPQEPYSVTVGYKIKRNDAHMLSVQFESYVYTGGAHGRPGMQSFNFLMPEGRQIGLADLVDGKRGLERVRDLAVDALDDQLLILDDSLHLKAQEDYFPDFVWQPRELELTFPPYTVAGYRTTTVHIPLSKLKGVIRPDPRKPAASFDCAGAKSRIEKAICSDAELARLDRQMEAKYAYWHDAVSVRAAKPNETANEKLGREVAQGYRDQAVAWQRVWLARRDHDCASGAVDCLKASYRVHIKDRPH